MLLEDVLKDDDYKAVFDEIKPLLGAVVDSTAPGTVEYALLACMAVIGREYRQQLRDYTLQLVINALNLGGFNVREGLKATGTATVTIASQATPFILEPTLLSLDGKIYLTTARLTILAGDTVGAVGIVAELPGTGSNRSGSMLFVGATPTGIVSVTGVADNGTDGEVTEASIRRALSYALTPGLISESDFLGDILNFGALAAKVLTDQATIPPIVTIYQYGLTTAQKAEYLAQIERPLGVIVNLGDLAVLPLDIRLDLVTLPNANGEAIRDEIVERFKELHQAIIDTIRQTKIGYLATVDGVSEVGLVDINGVSTDFIVPSNSVTVVSSVTVRLYDGISSVEYVAVSPYS